MSADSPSGKVPTTRVLCLISLLSRLIALFVRMRRQCSRGIVQYARVSAKPSRTTFAASFSLIGSSLGESVDAFVVAGAVSGPLVGALVGTGADEPVGLLVEHRVDGLLDGFPDQLAQFVFRGLLVE